MVNILLSLVATKLQRPTRIWWWLLIFIPLNVSAQSPDKLEWWGDQYMDEGNHAMAEAYYREAYNLDSSSFELGFKYGRACWHNHHDERAIQLFEKTIKKDQGKLRPEAFFYLGNLNMRNGRYPQAIQYWKKYKQKTKGVKEFHPEKEAVEFGIQSAEWAMKQLKVDSIHVSFAAINSEKSEGQAYWVGDSIVFQTWDSLSWKMGIADSALKTQVKYKETFQNHDVIHIIPFQNGRIGVGYVGDNDQQLIYKSESGSWKLIESIVISGTKNSMPSIGQWDGYSYLLFGSNRKGSVGGMDIWFSRWDNGQWSKPRPMDENINTKSDEIEPSCHNGQMYFSSKGHLGFGEFDIFRAKGSPDNWTEVTNMGIPINSPQNDIGLSIRQDTIGQKWIWSSSRKGTGCCLDLYTYNWKSTLRDQQDSIPKEISFLEMWLPLPLYFHNDEPSPRSNDTTTSWSYNDCYLSYVKKGEDYIRELNDESEWEQFEKAQLEFRYSQWQKTMAILESRLVKGDTLVLVVRGFASPLAAGDYNLRLTQRRISSIQNDLELWNNGSLKPFVGNQLKIKSLPFGETKSAAVSDDRNNVKESIYAKKAREERRIEIEGVEWRSSKGQLKRLGKAQ
jgi:tetratricopeptide (TPR) repeat protein